LKEVIPIGKQNYKIAEIDPYGRFLKIVTTNEAPTFYYLREMEKRRLTEPSPATSRLDDSFWALELKNLDGKKLKTSQFKGKYLLLNFWGEWCKPCVFEIPELVEAYNKISREKFDIISFLETGDPEAARRMIADKEMIWHHTTLSDELREKFKITAYPTNILIAPDGTVAQTAYQINRFFLFQFIQ
jgi:thiol-disulfide isomerase/thioredoxin